ncbi:50S ribosomal protein L3 [bacterium BMS3Abin10]|nr:50S ribosomal protein L3 [bacterium BMS3Abin10]GBE38697.1 50S ribosomal protein L3 [bacterium BMS3Bbin08]
MIGILGRKIGATQVFTGDGRAIPVTVIEAGPCKVVQAKMDESDGYAAVQVGFDEIKKEKNVTRGRLGHFKKVSLPPFRFLKEIKMEGMKVGDEITVDIFNKGDRVSITGTSKGKGFQGVMKRHNYSGGPGSHGSMFNRAPGSIGQSAYPSRVWKNKGMPGHMGSERTTTKNIEVVDVRKEQNIIVVKGPVPGAQGGYLIIRSVEATRSGKKD